MALTLDRSIQYLKGVGPARARLFSKLGIGTIEDLIFCFPRRYEDYSKIKMISRLEDDEKATVSATVISRSVVHSRKNRKLTIVIVKASDLSGILEAQWFFTSTSKQWIDNFSRNFIEGRRILFSGTAKRKGQSVIMSRPTWQYAEADNDGEGRIIPVYPLTEGINQRQVRTAIMKALDEGCLSFVKDPLPSELLQKYKLPDKQSAIREIHIPTSVTSVKQALKRVAFEEFLLLQLGLAYKRQTRRGLPGIRHGSDGPMVKKFLSALNFNLTNAQKRVINEIRSDMESEFPMNRLLQGDVGSGKTVVAAYAMVKAAESGYQCAMMAPTEVLAHQHFESLSEMFEPLGLHVGELRGGMSKSDREHIYEGLKTGALTATVGTHALLQNPVEFSNLGLVITDEQHRFGVNQRALLQAKGECADVLVMTATPIPRTLAMTLYGDLEISIIDEMPPGRKPIITKKVSGRQRKKVYDFLRQEIVKGRQAYVICPLVEESEEMDLRSVVEEAEALKKGYLSGLRIGLLHGRLSSVEKENTIDAFRDGELDVLISTTVVEVGVNVPNASVMVIENAERFGLSQLHQLRGRVGRGLKQSFCIMISDSKSEDTVARLDVMTKTNDGFEIAEEDLRLRGPGEIFGTNQHGLPDTRIANILRYMGIMKVAQAEARLICEDDAKLSSHKYAPLKAELMHRFGRWFVLSDVG